MTIRLLSAGSQLCRVAWRSAMALVICAVICFAVVEAAVTQGAQLGAVTSGAEAANVASASGHPHMHLRGQPIVAFVKREATLGFVAVVRFTTKAPTRSTGASLVGMGIAGIDHTGAFGASHSLDFSRDCYTASLNPAVSGTLAHPRVGQIVTLLVDVGEPTEQIRVRVPLGLVGSLQSATLLRRLGCIGPAHG